MSPPGLFPRNRVGDQALGFGAAVAADGIHPELSNPAFVPPQIGHQVVGGDSDILNHAALIDDQRDVGRGGDQFRHAIGIEVPQGRFRGSENLHDQRFPAPMTFGPLPPPLLTRRMCRRPWFIRPPRAS